MTVHSQGRVMHLETANTRGVHTVLQAFLSESNSLTWLEKPHKVFLMLHTLRRGIEVATAGRHELLPLGLFSKSLTKALICEERGNARDMVLIRILVKTYCSQKPTRGIKWSLTLQRHRNMYWVRDTPEKGQEYWECHSPEA